ncbi:glycoside hydrolase family 31 protein [Histidinibacterium lentulum]|uniref:Glycoside hydrolase family 31 protein n=1 Tax=Histidinibacterium lentulum TaxID=2480588 RepID=A0A3N2QR54_9RHOB|nr:TIM-barrel domain-containing protein [Histidinibacterium lentulum]ROT97698.1 glycoside hydrolase family 31 protein [Histidinibacterium lentulum]
MTHEVFAREESALVARLGRETLRIEALGEAIRVRATQNRGFDPGAVSGLLPDLPEGRPDIVTGPETASLSTDRLTVDLRFAERGIFPGLLLRFTDRRTGATLLEEEAPHFLWPGARAWTARDGDLWHVETRFRATPGERIHGLGQHQHGRFDQKGCVIELVQKNTQVVLPCLWSSAGYGLIWNSPGVGRVELAENHTRWVMEAVPQIDYVVVPGATPAEAIGTQTALTGRPPMMPEWAMGFWQCKLRYETQDEVLAVAREHRRRGLPLDCLVIDFFHWTKAGEWRFREEEFPDPSAMVAELREMGIEPMVSVWPSVNVNAETHAEMARAGWLIEARHGALEGAIFYDRAPDGLNALKFYDATNPDARAFHWSRVREGYVRHGIRSFWLDACEPEIYPLHPSNLRYHAGDGRAVSSAYPALHHRGYAEHAAADGLEGQVLLSRSAWLGSQRYPVLVWSGDVGSTFGEFAAQIRAGLNMAMSGWSWWTTDIGGFHGGDVRDPAFHELLIRWFQWGCFCPVMRLHGFREDAARDPRYGHDFSFGGAENEVWSFGDDVYGILSSYMHLRTRLRPYIAAQMRHAAETGIPPMRPAFFDFPDDPALHDVSDAYLFGPDLLVAPVIDAGATTRPVRLPAGVDWTCAWTGTRHPGGRWIEADAPLDRIPLFLRDGADLPIRP